MCGEPRSKHALIQKHPEITPYMKGAFPPQRPALYAKVRLFLLTLNFKTVRNPFEEEKPLSYKE